MADSGDSSIKFFTNATSKQWTYVLSQYKEVFKIRAQTTRRPAETIKLDNWYQEELPKLLQARKDRQLRHDELVQITKWKLWRTKNRAGLLDLVRMNTETAVKQISTKAFKKCPTNLHGAISALVNLKGIGVATASAILCAAAPEICPFMADECLNSVPGIENTNYTVNEFIAFADQIKACCERLQAEDPTAKWTPHKVELSLWTHYWIKELKLNLLDKMPKPNGLEGDNENMNENDDDDDEEYEDLKNSKKNGDSHSKMSTNGGGDKVLDDDSNISVPISNTSEVEEKSNDSTKDNLDGDMVRSFGRRSDNNCSNSNSNSNSNTNNSINMSKNMTSNSSSSCSKNNGSAYNCIEDSKDGLGPCSDDNARQQLITNGDNSNLSYSNLSSEDLNNSTAENTTDNILDVPTDTTTNTNTNTTTHTNATTNNNINNNNSNCTSSSSSLSSSTTTSTTTTTTNKITPDTESVIQPTSLTATSLSSSSSSSSPTTTTSKTTSTTTTTIHSNNTLSHVPVSTLVTKNNGNVGNGENNCANDIDEKINNIVNIGGDSKILDLKKSELNSMDDAVVPDIDNINSSSTPPNTSIKRPLGEIITSEVNEDNNGSLESKKSRIE